MEDKITIKQPFNPSFTNVGSNLASKTKGDKVIWALVVLLTLVSLLAVYSATGSLAYKNYKGNNDNKAKARNFLYVSLFIFFYPGRKDIIKKIGQQVIYKIKSSNNGPHRNCYRGDDKKPLHKKA